MASEKRLIDVTPENIKAVLEKVPYYPDEIWKFTAMTERFPTVDAVEVVHGRWAREHTVNRRMPMCSECQKKATAETNYCPHCGAKMDGERKDNERKAD